MLTAAGVLPEGRFCGQDGIDDGRGRKDESSSGCLFYYIQQKCFFGYPFASTLLDIDIIYIWILTRYMIVNVFINMFTNIYFYYDVLSMFPKFHADVGATNDPNGFVSVRLPTQESLPTMWASLDFATSTHRMRERRTTVLPCAEEFRS